jgi:hypothetical protein
MAAAYMRRCDVRCGEYLERYLKQQRLLERREGALPEYSRSVSSSLEVRGAVRRALAGGSGGSSEHRRRPARPDARRVRSACLRACVRASGCVCGCVYGRAGGLCAARGRARAPQVSLECIGRENAHARRALDLLSFGAPDGISKVRPHLFTARGVLAVPLEYRERCQYPLSTPSEPPVPSVPLSTSSTLRPALPCTAVLAATARPGLERNVERCNRHTCIATRSVAAGDMQPTALLRRRSSSLRCFERSRRHPPPPPPPTHTCRRCTLPPPPLQWRSLWRWASACPPAAPDPMAHAPVWSPARRRRRRRWGPARRGGDAAATVRHGRMWARSTWQFRRTPTSTRCVRACAYACVHLCARRCVRVRVRARACESAGRKQSRRCTNGRLTELLFCLFRPSAYAERTLSSARTPLQQPSLLRWRRTDATW